MPGHENRPAVLPRLWKTLTLAVLPALAASLAADPAWAADADADGMDDEFELFFGLNTTADDSALDPDGDGLNNLTESQRGTDPFAADTDRDGFWDGWDSNALSRAWVSWGAPGFTRSNAMVYAWPAWMVSAFQEGGEWQTNPPAWHVGAWVSNGVGALNLDVDRGLLTNDAVLRLDYLDHSNASLFVDLYDTNEAVVVTDLFQNVLGGGGAVTSRTFGIPFEGHPEVVGIRIRRGAGETTMYGSLLYVDKDGDGLDADQEAQLGTSDLLLDSDHDGFSDFEETLVYGSDPASALSVPYGRIDGWVSYAGRQTGTIHVVAAPLPGAWTSAWSAVVAQPGTYALAALPLRQTYEVKAYRDGNGNGTRDFWEPWGAAQPMARYLAADLGSVPIALADPDSDGDGMSDWAELLLGMDPLISNHYARLPFLEYFETNTVQVGTLQGQNGWLVSPTNGAVVQTNSVYEGRQAMRLAASGTGTVTEVKQLFVPSGAPVVWCDLYIQAQATALTNAPAGCSSAMGFDTRGYLTVWDGLLEGSNRWVALTNLPPVEEGAWTRLTICNDYSNQQWLVCVNGRLAARGLGFASPLQEFTALTFQGGSGTGDRIVIGTTIPADLSLDGDNLPDAWELRHFGHLEQTDAGDPDGDGLSNAVEYNQGTDPLSADSDGDGLDDGAELLYGRNPAVSNAYCQLPFVERFEADTVAVGELNGQNGWSALPLGTSWVQTNSVYEGARALKIAAPQEPAHVRQLFAVTNAPVVWVDLRLLASETQLPTNVAGASAVMAFDGNGYLRVYDGLAPAGNRWLTLTNVAPLATGAWARLTAKLDYPAQRWDVYVEGVLATQGLGFASPVSRFTMLTLEGQQAGVDAVTASTNRPADLSADGDRLPDAWEMEHFHNLEAEDTGDPDHDGVSNLEEYRHGTDPLAGDTDGDTMPDGWEIGNGLIPTDAADAALDADGDGLTNLAEYQHGTDPRAADTDGDGLNDAAEVTAGTNPLNPDTDGDGMPDGWEVTFQLNPLNSGDGAVDSDNDGLSNLDECQYGLDPRTADLGMPTCAPASVSAGQGTLTNAIRVSWAWSPSCDGGPKFSTFLPWIQFDIWRSPWPSTGIATRVGSTYAPLASNYTDTAVVPGAAYRYTVRARNPYGPGAQSAAVTGYAAGIPPPVAGVGATDGAYSNRVLVSWDNAGLTTGFDYRVWRAASNDSVAAAQLPYAPDKSSYTDTNVAAGTRYWYWVRRSFLAGATTWISAFSTPDDGYCGAPPPPTNVLASDGDFADRVRIQWPAISGAPSYNVYRGTGTVWAAAASVAAGLTNAVFEDMTAGPGTSYWYWVQASNVWGLGTAGLPDSGYCGMPPAPTGLTASDGQYPDKVRVTWVGVSNAVSYEVWRGVTGDLAAASPVATNALTSWDDTTAQQGVLYTYWVRARHAAQGGGAFSAGDAGHLAVPTPAGVQAAENVSTGAVRVTWQAVAGNVVYEVWRDPNGAQGSATRLGATAALAFEDATAQAGMAYAYWVKASNVVGWVSGFSAADWGCLALAAPAEFTASAGSDTGRVTLVWAGVPGATRYEVRRSGSNALAGAAAVATVTGLGWTDTPVAPGQVYWYWVRGLGASLPVGAFGAAAKGGTCPLPPGNVTATDGIYGDRVRVTWTAATGAAVYEVRRAATNDVDAASIVGTVAAPVTVFDDLAVAGRSGYWYWVRALNAEGWAGALAGGDRGGLVLPGPTGGTASRGTEADGVLVSWQAVPGAVTYEVLRAETNSLAQALPVGTSTNTAYRDTTAESGTWYWYWVRGLNADGVIGEAGTCGSGYRPLPAPAVWASQGDYHDQIDVGWSNVSSATAYRLWEDGALLGTYETNGVIGIAPRLPAHTYVYRVQALTGDLTNNLVGYATGSTHAVSFMLLASHGTYTDKVAVTMQGCCSSLSMRHLVRAKLGTTQQTVLAEAPGRAFEDTNVAAGVQYQYQAINSVNSWSGSDVGYARCDLDLDVDSDNNNGLDAPARDDAEEAQQNSTNYPGKLFGVHDDDADHDGIPGFADGYDRDSTPSADDDEPCRFVPVVLELPANADFGRAGVTFIYDASDPAGVVTNTDGTYALPSNGSLRLWRADWRGASPTNRLIRPPNSTGYSHFIPANRAFPVSELGFDTEHRVVTNFLEGVRPGAAALAVSIDPDGTNSIAGVPAADEIKVTVLKVEFKELWETQNKANQIFNPTRKDDPVNDSQQPDASGDTYGVPRNKLYLVPDPSGDKYKATVKADIEPAAIRAKVIAAVYAGDTLFYKVPGSDTAFNMSGECGLEFSHFVISTPEGDSGVDVQGFKVRVGFDANNNGQLDQDEILPFVVKNTTTGQAIGDPTIRGSSGSKYAAAKNSVDDIVDGDWTSPGWATSLVLPHAKRLLQIFRDGNASGVPTDKQPTGSAGVSFNAFTGYFAEWLTHNSGASFDDDGNAILTEYFWDRFTSLADLVATAPQVEDPATAYYNQTVYPVVTNYFASLPVGSTAEFPSTPGDGFDVVHTNESPAWVTPYTETFDTWLLNLIDDVNGTIGRGRLLFHKARYKVEKQETLFGSELVVTEVRSWGEVIDLYDFNHDVGGAAQDAAILQIGYGNGSYGAPRNRGKIFRDRIEFNKLYTELP